MCDLYRWENCYIFTKKYCTCTRIFYSKYLFYCNTEYKIIKLDFSSEREKSCNFHAVAFNKQINNDKLPKFQIKLLYVRNEKYTHRVYLE